jgi:NEDD8-activating enzyme E1 regulatory subunit
VKRFCKEAHHLRLVRGGESIDEEYRGLSPNAPDVGKLFEQEPESSAMYYFILRGVDRFYSKYNAYPGACDDHVEPDIGKLKNCVASIMSEYQSPSVICKDDYIHEVCRYGGSELHSIASFIGGCAAQEAIKLITGQYVPFRNLFLYNTMTSETITLRV